MNDTGAAGPLLRVEDLSVVYTRRRGLRSTPFHAVSGVSFDIERGRTMGLVGESGSGKSTIGRALLGLAPVSEGRVAFRGEDISAASNVSRRRIARHLQVVFQDPYGSLNPAMSVGSILAEPLIAQRVPRAAAQAKIAALLGSVGLPQDAIHRLPREFSGGQRQRIAIARALAVEPDLIVCDEAVSALDLTSQSRVLDLLLSIQKERGISYLFISHDLDVVRHMSHEIAVLSRGAIVEKGSAEQVTGAPRHPYTQRLLLSSPVANIDRQAERRRARRQLADAEKVSSGA